jgi:hypothetical protein
MDGIDTSILTVFQTGVKSVYLQSSTFLGIVFITENKKLRYKKVRFYVNILKKTIRQS